MKIRNPNTEIRRKPELRKSKSFTGLFRNWGFPSDFGIRFSDFFRHSSFVIRISVCNHAFSEGV